MKYIYKIREFLSKYRVYRFLCYFCVAVFYIPYIFTLELVYGVYDAFEEAYYCAKREYRAVRRIVKKDLEVL